jgi:uncharacterized repeat protein (TIGR01451 family)
MTNRFMIAILMVLTCMAFMSCIHAQDFNGTADEPISDSQDCGGLEIAVPSDAGESLGDLDGEDVPVSSEGSDSQDGLVSSSEDLDNLEMPVSESEGNFDESGSISGDADKLGMAVPSESFESHDADVLASKSSDNVNSKAHLVLDNDADKENIYLGDYVTWIVSVINEGPGTAKNVKVFDQLPEGLKYIGYNATKGTFNPKSGIWNIGNLSIDDGEVFLNILTKSVSVGKKINKAKLTTDSINLNDENYEEEEMDVFERPVSNHDTDSNSNTDSISKSAHVSVMHPTANPIALCVISLFGIFICIFKKN